MSKFLKKSMFVPCILPQKTFVSLSVSKLLSFFSIHQKILQKYILKLLSIQINPYMSILIKPTKYN